ncbi:hypothetical protein GQ600_26144 [Phytophthora cactorum]|nr:hypothetical protein GQ600_26144 [Phytophthora cactorum]
MADRRAAKAAAKKKDNPSAKRKKTETKIPGKKKISKCQQAALAREGKQAKESRAVARAETAGALRSATKAKERGRAALEERWGSEARKRALADLKRNRAAGTTTATGTTKRKKSGTASHTAESTCDSPARSHCPHVVDVIDGEVDNVSTTDAASVDQPRQSQQPEVTPQSPAGIVEATQSQVPPVPSFEDTSFDDETLNSELDGEDGADPDEWYIEPETEASPDTTDVNASLDEVDACEEPEEAASDEISTTGGHGLVEFPELTQLREGFLKRLQHQCKVCSIRKKKVGERSATRFYCETCSEGDERVYLCDKIRPKNNPGNKYTCFQIRHDLWKNGDERPPPLVGRGCQMSPLGKTRSQPTDSDETEEEKTEEEELEQEEKEEEEQDKMAGTQTAVI